MTLLPLTLRNFAILLGLVLALAASLLKPVYHGDLDEYALMTVAIASHGTPDIRQEDIARARVLLPEYAAAFDRNAEGMRAGGEVSKPGFIRGQDGRYYAIHFFAYSALAAIPFKVYDLAGLDPMGAFKTVNAFAIWVLGIALFRLFGSGQRAATALLLFLACGVAPYALWLSPECMTAAFLLAGLILFVDGMPVLGGILAGLGAMQNPSLVFFAPAAPLLLLATGRSGWRGLLRPAVIGGAVLAGGMALLPFAFNQAVLGMPSYIARTATDPQLISLARLHSFFFDLNQGMVVAIPALMVALVAARSAWRSPQWRVLLWGVLFTVALALPSLSALNWNSAASGVMRYGVWAAMPLVFAFLWRLQGAQRWPWMLVGTVVVIQAGMLAWVLRYDYLQLNPVSRYALENFTRQYNPDPEILFERLVHDDVFGFPNRVHTYSAPGGETKLFFNERNVAFDEQMCGKGRVLSADNDTVKLAGGWHYLHGQAKCVQSLVVDAHNMDGAGVTQFGAGWSGIEMGGGDWNGRWSNAGESRITLQLPAGLPLRRLVFHGIYFDNKGETSIEVNGKSFGTHRLDKAPVVELSDLDGTPRQLDIVLRHHGHRVPPPGDPDTRALGVFLQKIVLR